MSVRYSISGTPEELAERYSIDLPKNYKARFNAAPTQVLPVITSRHPQHFSYYFWGANPEMAKGKMLSKRWTHVDAIKMMEKRAAREALKTHRCLVPANGFYLWKKVSKKGQVPYRFVMPDGDFFAFAGIWESYDEIESNQTIHRFSLITVPSHPSIKEFSPDMPLILSRDQEKAWLSQENMQSIAPFLITPPPALIHYPVSPEINLLTRDYPGLINPVKPADQFGNYSLFDFSEERKER